MMKKIAAMILALCLMITMFPAMKIPASAAEGGFSSEKTANGYKGKYEKDSKVQYEWEYTASTRTLSFSGLVSEAENIGVGEVVKNAKKLVFEKGSEVTAYSFNKDYKTGLREIEGIGESQFVSVEEIEVLGTTYIGEFAFFRIPNLKSVKIWAADGSGYDPNQKFEYYAPEGAVTIGSRAFMDCKALTEVKLPDEVAELKPWVFGGCENLKSIQLPAKLIKLYGNAVQWTGIEKLTIPRYVSSYVPGIYYSDSIKEINVDPNNQYFSSVNGVMMDKKQSAVYAWPSAKETVSLPSTVKTIADNAACTGLKTLRIPEGITTMESDAVFGNNLESVYLPSTIKKMNARAIIGRKITDLYYSGTQSDWNKITIVPDLYTQGYLPLLEAKVHFKDGSVIDLKSLRTDHPTESRYNYESSGETVSSLSALLSGKTVSDSVYSLKRQISWKFDEFVKGINYSASLVLPGLTQTNTTLDVSKPTVSRNMVPQGVCTTGSYILISAYDAGKGNSVIYVLEKSLRKYLTTLVLKDNNCHVGGLAYVYGSADGGAVFVADSRKTDNNKPCIRSIPLKEIQKAVENGRDAVPIDAPIAYTLSEDKEFGEDLVPSFLCYYGGYLYIGKCDTEDRTKNAEKSTNYVVGYRVKDGKILANQHTATIKLIGISQGIGFKETGNGTFMISSASFGRYNPSTLHIALINTCNDATTRIPWIRSDKTSDQQTISMPNMSEDMDIDNSGNGMRIVFESGAAFYQQDSDDPTTKAEVIATPGKGRRALDYMINADLNKLMGKTLKRTGGHLKLMENSESEEITKVTSGLCGPFTGYTLYSNGELVISGQGEIQKTDTGGYPWNYHKDKITSIVIGADVTNVPQNAFYGCSNLQSVQVADLSDSNTALILEENCFGKCENLTTVYLPEKDYKIHEKTFDGSGKITVCSDSSSVKSLGDLPNITIHSHDYKIAEHVDASVTQPYAYDLFECSCGSTIIKNVEEKEIASPAFDDVQSPSWYSDAVYYCFDKGYMAGKSETKFDPSGKVTRGTITQVLYAMEGKPTVSKSAGFKDVANGKWYADSVNWAASIGIVAGYSKEEFRPNNAITRQQMAAIMYQYAKYKKYDTSANGDISKFKDNSGVTKYAKEPMKWAVGHSIISGTNIGLEPKGTATRAQIAVILRAFDNNVRN